MDIAPTRDITMAAGTIRIGVTGIGTGTNARSETKPYKTGIEDWLFRCEFVLERGIPAQA
jgi:hypothetical protein